MTNEFLTSFIQRLQQSLSLSVEEGQIAKQNITEMRANETAAQINFN